MSFGTPGGNRGKKLPPDPLTPDEARALVMAFKPRYRTGARNRAHVILLWRCGLRAAESCSLDLEDVRWGEDLTGSVRVRLPKGVARGKAPREVGFDKKTGEALARWLWFRGREAGPFFTTASGTRVGTKYLRRVIPAIARRAGIMRRVHPHALRHTFARELYDEGIGIVHIQRALGHGSLQVTAQYLESIGATDVVEVTAGRSW